MVKKNWTTSDWFHGVAALTKFQSCIYYQDQGLNNSLPSDQHFLDLVLDCMQLFHYSAAI